jgi:hypothetical protein
MGASTNTCCLMENTVLYMIMVQFLLSFPKVKVRLEWMLLKFDRNICVGVFCIV